MVRNAAFWVQHGCGGFVGIVAFDPDKHTAGVAARKAWGVDATYSTELGMEDLLAITKAGPTSIFTCSINE